MTNKKYPKTNYLICEKKDGTKDIVTITYVGTDRIINYDGKQVPVAQQKPLDLYIMTSFPFIKVSDFLYPDYQVAKNNIDEYNKNLNKNNNEKK